MWSEVTQPQQLADEAESILGSAQHTLYTHDTHVDASTGTYDMDCSAYVGYVLEQCAREHYGTIHNGGGAHGPLAVDFYNHFAALPSDGVGGWRPIQPLAQALRGDIVAWKRDVISAGDNTGHVFFVADDPVVFDDGVVAVSVYDSSDVIHYDDTRGHGGDSPATGLGCGKIHFRYLDSRIQFKFGPGDPYHDAPVAIGRIEPLSVQSGLEVQVPAPESRWAIPATGAT